MNVPKWFSYYSIDGNSNIWKKFKCFHGRGLIAIVHLRGKMRCYVAVRRISEVLIWNNSSTLVRGNMKECMAHLQLWRKASAGACNVPLTFSPPF